MTNGRMQRLGFRRWVLVSVMTAGLVLSPRLHRPMQAADGDLDPTFGTGGLVVTNFGNLPGQVTAAVAAQRDGKIVVAGTAFGTARSGFAVARYNADGSLDASFAGGGTTVAEFPGTNANAGAFALAIQADGRIIVAGSVTTGSTPFDLAADFAVARILPGGALDPSFDGDGRVQTDLGGGSVFTFEGAQAVTLQTDGRIIVAGTRTLADRTSQFALVRYGLDGSLDASFDDDGKVTTAFGPAARARGVGVQSDGRIIAGGSTSVGGQNVFALARYNADGSLDATFGIDGQVTTAAANGAFGTALVVQPDDKTVLVGDVITGGTDFGIARYDLDGALDTSFNGGAVLTTDIGAPLDTPSAVALQADGAIVVAGTSFPSGTSNGDFILTRYTTDGLLDTSFGVGGVASADFNGNDRAAGVAVQIDGRIVVAGQRQAPGAVVSQFALARFQGPARHALTFFLHGTDLPPTAEGFTMAPTPAPGTQVSVGTRTWFSDPTVSGSFQSGATFRVTLPCVWGLGVPKTVLLAVTSSAGGQEQVLGQGVQGLRLCRDQTIDIAVATPVTLTNRRLKLTISSTSHLPMLIPLGRRTFLRGSAFVGVP